MSANKIRYISTKGPLDLCCESLNLAYWTNDKYHVEQAREKLLWALSGDSTNSLDNLVDLIANAIDETIDVGWTSEQAAERIVDVLLEGAIPAIAAGSDA